MTVSFAAGKHAFGFCDICGFRYPLRDLKITIIKQKPTNILACPTCWDKDQPQLQVGLYPVYDPQALLNPRPDGGFLQDAGAGSRMISWGWNPVGGSRSIDSKLTPDPLQGKALTGSVIVVVT